MALSDEAFPGKKDPETGVHIPHEATIDRDVTTFRLPIGHRAAQFSGEAFGDGEDKVFTRSNETPSHRSEDESPDNQV